MKPAIEKLRGALSKMHARACGDTSAIYMSVPARPEEDADLLLSAALDELEGWRGKTYCLYCGLALNADDDIGTLIRAHVDTCEAHPVHAERTRSGKLMEALNLALNSPDEDLDCDSEGWCENCQARKRARELAKEAGL